MAAPNVDDFVDYKAEYMAMIRHAHISGDQVIGLCPFHEDTSDSFSANVKTGQWVCFAGCGQGNFVTFWARYYGVDNATALKQICEKYHVDMAPKKERKPRKPYTVEEYARDKGMSSEYLAAEWGVRTVEPPNGPSFVYMPYYYSTGELAQERRRFADKDLDFKRERNAPKKIQALYGEHKLASIKDYIVIVEGESDVQAMWYMGICHAVGVSGASNFNSQQAGKVAACDKPVAIHIEKDANGDPDSGGKTFAVAVPRALGAAGLKAAIAVWSCRDIDPECKDPSDILIKYGREKGAQLINAAINAAKRVDMSAWEKPPLTNPPVDLECPKGWSISDEGIYRLGDFHSEKARKAKPEQMENGPELVTTTPILILARVKSLEARREKDGEYVDSGDKKERIQLAYRVDNKWENEIFTRSTVFSSRSVVDLTEYGCDITSENGKDMVNFLSSLMRANAPKIPIKYATTTLGWQDDKTFIPGKPGDIIVDMPDAFMRIYRAMKKKRGTLDDWVAMVSPFRRNDVFRLMLAASFGAPLLKVLDQRSFTLYVWYDSLGGKTIGLRTALSIWGPSDDLMSNFNSTITYIERKAKLMNDLPLGIDERQQASRNQLTLDQILYMVANGAPRGRADKNADIKDDTRWRTIAIATGEEPLTDETSQTGTSNRQIVINGRPFDEEEEAAEMYGKVSRCYGSAGPAFIQKLVDNTELVKQTFEAIRKYLGNAKSRNLAHLAHAAILGTADYLSSIWIFGEDADKAIETAKRIAAKAANQQEQFNSGDIKLSASRFILDWISENESNFRATEYSRGPIYGWYDEDVTDIININPKSLKEGMAKAGYSFNQIKYHLEHIRAIRTCERKLGEKITKEFTVVKRHRVKYISPDNRTIEEEIRQRVIELNLRILADSLGEVLEDELDDEPQSGDFSAQLGFSDLEPPGPDLPF